MVARQSIAWNPFQKGIRPVGGSDLSRRDDRTQPGVLTPGGHFDHDLP